MRTAESGVEGLLPPPLDGLTEKEAAARLAAVGPNLPVPEKRRGGWLVILGRSLTEPMSVLLLIAAVTYVVLGDTVDAVAAVAALVPIAGVSVVLERRAERALEELAALAAPTSIAWRDGSWRVVPTTGIVPGDLVAVREGDIVSADGELVVGERVVVDESALTGESLPVTKTAGGAGDSVWAGTTVSAGRGLVRVATTGPATRYGEIARLVAAAERGRTPLETMIRRLVLRLGIVAIVFAVLVGVVELVRGGGWGAAIIAGVSLGIAAIPEEFPLVFTIYLALGARRLAHHRALVRTLTAVETLGSTTVICTDKTGTLTLGSLSVSAVVPLDSTEEEVVAAAVLASEPEPFDPLDIAIVAAASARGVDVDDLHAGELVGDFEFDPVHKHVTHVWRHDGRLQVTAKGAVEGILGRSASSGEAAALAETMMAELGAAGMRVVGVAAGPLHALPADRAEAEQGLRLLGLVAFSDPTRPEVPAAIADCRAAGIRVVMITGDHPVTARTVAAGLGLTDDDGRVVTGSELDATDDDHLPELVESATVFARIRPEQKHRLVEGLRAKGEVVAMTGDGINDAPALRKADIGVAMGERGTAVAREAASLVLLDDNFATIVEAVREGRRIFANLQNAFGYLVAFHFPLLLLALVVPLLGEPLLLLPFNLIALEFLLHPIVALVFENDPPPDGVMARPPRGPEEGLIGRRLLMPAVRGLTLTAVTLGLYLATLAAGTEAARGMALAALFVGELLLVVTERTGARPTGERNRILVPLLAVGAGVVAVLFLVLGDVMGVAALSGERWAIALAAAAAATLWGEPFRRRR